MFKKILLLSIFLLSLHGLYVYVPTFQETKERYQIALAAKDLGIEVIELPTIETELQNASFIIVASSAGILVSLAGVAMAKRTRKPM